MILLGIIEALLKMISRRVSSKVKTIIIKKGINNLLTYFYMTITILIK